MALQKSRLHGTFGLFLILLIGFGFGASLIMQRVNTAGHDMGSMGIAESPVQNGSPFTLLLVFLSINVTLVIAAFIFKRIRSKRAAASHPLQPTMEFEGGRK